MMSKCGLGNHIRAFLAIILLVSCWAVLGFAQWPTTPEIDLRIAYNSTSIELSPMTPEGMWIMMSGGHSDYYFQSYLQRIDRNGFVLLDSIIQVQGPEHTHAGESIVADTLGGVYLLYNTATYIDYPHTYNYSLRLQRYDKTGEPLWPNYGQVVTQMDSVSRGTLCQMIADDSGGVIVVWLAPAGSVPKEKVGIYIQRFSTEGNTLWAKRGKQVNNRHTERLQALSDDNGGVLIQTGKQFYRFNTDGNSLWPKEDSISAFQYDPMQPHHLGGAIVTKPVVLNLDNYPYWDHAIQTNRLALDGSWRWGDSDLPLTDTLTVEVPGKLRYMATSLPSGHTVYGWYASYAADTIDWNTSGIWMQVLNGEGDKLLPDGGKHIVPDSMTILEALVPSGNRDVLCFYRHHARDHDLFVTRLDTGGQIVWEDSVERVSIRDEGVLDAVSDGHGGAIVATGNGTLKQINADGELGNVINQLPYSSPRGGVPKTIELLPNYPNPFNGSTTIQYKVYAQTSLRIEVYNIRGQKIQTLTERIHESGQYSVKWNGNTISGESAPSGIYYLQLHTEEPEYIQARKLVLIR